MPFQPDPDKPLDFVRRHTALMSPPLVPEVRLHLAVEIDAIWQNTEEELAAAGLPSPFWAFAWAGGQALARYCLDQPETVAGRHVLDFAAGGAVSGIAALKAGARAVDASELDPFAIAAIKANSNANVVEITCHLGDLVGTDAGWDVVLAGDVFYDADIARRVGAWLETLAERGATVLIGDPGRAFLPKDRMECLASYSAPVTRALEDQEVRYAKVWRFR